MPPAMPVTRLARSGSSQMKVYMQKELIMPPAVAIG